LTYPIRRFDYAVVYNIVDGDTCDIEVDLGYSVKLRQRFRLARIDTPERGDPGYIAAKEFLIGATRDKAVTLDVTKLDKYGRFLCELMVDGRNINDAMLFAGLAKPYGAPSGVLVVPGISNETLWKEAQAVHTTTLRSDNNYFSIRITDS